MEKDEDGYYSVELGKFGKDVFNGEGILRSRLNKGTIYPEKALTEAIDKLKEDKEPLVVRTENKRIIGEINPQSVVMDEQGTITGKLKLRGGDLLTANIPEFSFGMRALSNVKPVAGEPIKVIQIIGWDLISNVGDEK